MEVRAQSTVRLPECLVKIIVSFAPGGSTDVIARLVGSKLTEEHAQKFLIENRPGAGGNVGVAGEVSSGLMGFTSASPHVKTGRVKAVGVATAARLASNSEWPAINETVPGFIASNWVRAVVSAGTPRAIIDKLNADFNRGLKLAEVREKLNAVGTETGGSTVKEFANMTCPIFSTTCSEARC
jgi:tripartite-type tricarboxylate transporter receptor subunit TctC